MTTIILYLHSEKVLYTITGTKTEKGEFNINEAEAFLEKNRPDILNIIVAKPQLIFRKMEFPFRNKKKIHIVLPSEMEETLPESSNNFLFSLDFFHTDKNKTVVNVYAIHTTLFSHWNSLAKKYKAKIFFFSDTSLFNQLLRQYINEKNYIAIYVEGEYLLINITEDGIITGSYSYILTQSTKTEMTTLIKGILEQKDFPVFICGDDYIKKELNIEEHRMKHLNLPSGIETKYMFHSISSLNQCRRKFIPLVLSPGKKIPVVYPVLLFAFLVVSFISFSPYFQIADKQRELDIIENEMRQIFISTFPDVQNVVNPLVQAREIVQKNEGMDIKTGVPSVLNIMADITLLFPENIDVRVEVFRIVGNIITLSGTVDSLKSLEIMKTGIEASENFILAGMGPISFDARHRVNFDITLTMD